MNKAVTREDALREAYHLCDDALRKLRDHIPAKDRQTHLIIKGALVSARAKTNEMGKP